MTNVWCVRADGGKYTEHFIHGGYAGIGWNEIDRDLSAVRTRDELYEIVKASYPNVSSPLVIGNYVGQVGRFLLEIAAGDYVITPAADPELLYYGQVAEDPSYYFATTDDGCPYRHRRRVRWAREPLRRGEFSVAFQNTMKAALTVFAISHEDEFLEAIGKEVRPQRRYDPYVPVLEQLLHLDPKEFEILVGHLLTALGFEAEVIGRTGDGGVDAVGELNIGNLARVRVYVQAKRYKPGSKISANVVKQLRQAIPFGGQGAFITTADYQDKAAEVALEHGYPRIGLINGRQLVDLLVEHWNKIPPEFHERLGLKPGLVRI